MSLIPDAKVGDALECEYRRHWFDATRPQIERVRSLAPAVARAAEAMHDAEREYVQDMVAVGYSDVKPFDAFLAKLREVPLMPDEVADAARCPVPVCALPAGHDGPHVARRVLQDEIRAVLNRHSAENESNTPDFILAAYLMACLEAFNLATSQRERWYGWQHSPLGMIRAEEAPDA